jgi:hypothetical protein
MIADTLSSFARIRVIRYESIRVYSTVLGMVVGSSVSDLLAWHCSSQSCTEAKLICRFGTSRLRTRNQRIAISAVRQNENVRRVGHRRRVRDHHPLCRVHRHRLQRPRRSTGWSASIKYANATPRNSSTADGSS